MADRSLRIRLTASTDSYRQEMRRASRESNHFLKQTSSGFAGINRNIQLATNNLKSFASTIAWGLAVNSILKLADNYTLINARLKLATTSSQDLAFAQAQLYEISMRTGTAYEANAQLFSRAAASMREAGYNTKDVLDTTEALAAGLQLSGASAAEASSVITQMSQALASGVLRGQEFNAINENGDRIARALAAGLGITRGELRKLANDGKLTTDIVVKALKSQLGTIRNEVSQMPSSISKGMQNLQTSFQKYIGEVNHSLGATEKLGAAMSVAANNVDVMGKAVLAVATIYAGRYLQSLTKVASVKIESVKADYQAANATRSTATAQIQAAQADLAALEAKGRMLSANRELMAQHDLIKAYNIQRSALVAQETAATERLVMAQKQLAGVQSVTMSMLSKFGAGALSMIGGIPGAILLSVTAMGYFKSSITVAREEAQKFGDAAKYSAENLERMNKIQLNAAMLAIQNSIKETREEINRLTNELILLDNGLDGEKIRLFGIGFGALFSKETTDKATTMRGKIEDIKEVLKQEEDALNKVNNALDGYNEKKQEAGNQKPILGFSESEITKLYVDQLNKLNQIKNAQIDINETLRIRRALNESDLKNLGENQKQALINLAGQIDASNAMTQAQKEYNTLVLSLRTTEEKQLDEFREKVNLINQMEASEKRRRELIEKAIPAEKPPEYSYTQSYNGIGSDLINVAEQEKLLNDWYGRQKSMYDQFLEDKAVSQEDYNAKVLSLDEKLRRQQDSLQSAYQLATLGMFSNVTGQIADMFMQTAGETSAAYKIMFAASKAAGIAQAIISTEVAATKAMELGPIAGIPAASLIRGLGYASVGIIAGQTIAGMAHSGIDNVPKEGTWLLDKGERVLSPKQNADFTDFMKNGSNSPKIVINNYAGADISTNYDDREEIIRISVNRAVKEISGQLGSGTGDTSRALRQRWNTNTRTG